PQVSAPPADHLNGLADGGAGDPRKGVFRTERFSTVGLFDGTQQVLSQAMAGSSARQQVLANNIANADTPNYHRSDLDFRSQLANAIAGDNLEQLKGLTYQSATDDTAPVQADGNSVNIDTEMAGMSQNALDYETLVEIANARIKMISSAIGGAAS